MSNENSLKKGIITKSRKYIVVVLVTFGLLLGLSFAFVSAVHANATDSSEPRMVGSQWAVYEQNTLPNGNLHFYPASHADTIATGGVEFSMPDATSLSPIYVNYLLDTFTTSLMESNIITATIQVDTTCSSLVPPDAGVTSPCPATMFAGNPNGVLPQPITVRLFIQSNLPEDGTATCVGGHKNVNNYWWSNTPVAATTANSGSYYEFTMGGTAGMTVTLSVPLNPSDWSGICGSSGAANPAGFDSALMNIKYIGLSFGSGFFFANGMGVDGATGMATFQLQSYTV